MLGERHNCLRKVVVLLRLGFGSKYAIPKAHVNQIFSAKTVRAWENGRFSACDKTSALQTPNVNAINRRTFLKSAGATAGAVALSHSPSLFCADAELEPIRAEVQKRHDEAVR